jgi:hypothetical protein
VEDVPVRADVLVQRGIHHSLLLLRHAKSGTIHPHTHTREEREKLYRE